MDIRQGFSGCHHILLGPVDLAGGSSRSDVLSKKRSNDGGIYSALSKWTLKACMYSRKQPHLALPEPAGGRAFWEGSHRELPPQGSLPQVRNCLGRHYVNTAIPPFPSPLPAAHLIAPSRPLSVPVLMSSCAQSPCFECWSRHHPRFSPADGCCLIILQPRHSALP